MRLPELGWIDFSLSESQKVIPDDPFIQGLEEIFQRPNVARLM
jgi:hypothetical protein